MEAQLLCSSDPTHSLPDKACSVKTNLESTKDKLSWQSLNEYPLADPVQLTSLEIIVRELSTQPTKQTCD